MTSKFAGPEKFCKWLSSNVHKDKLGSYRYHPRSDSHSKALARFILEDLVSASSGLRNARANKISFSINCSYLFRGRGKEKTLDLAIGRSSQTTFNEVSGVPQVHGMDELLASCELKTVMTEHGKAQPRIFDELSSSHEIVHQSLPDAIAAGVTVINSAPRFISPLRQVEDEEATWTIHKQPHVTQRMVKHLRGLGVRTSKSAQGFDAYSNVVISCDNEGPATLHTAMPAPQPGDTDHYDTFIHRFATALDALAVGSSR